MSEMSSFNRLNDLSAFKNAVDSFLSCSFACWPEQPMEPLSVTRWTPRAVTEWILLVDIIESDRDYLIRAELPDILAEDVQVTEDSGMLTIIGERKAAKHGIRHHMKNSQESCGSFGRKFSIPNDARPANIKVEFREGILRVRLAKNGNSNRRKNEVH